MNKLLAMLVGLMFAAGTASAGGLYVRPEIFIGQPAPVYVQPAPVYIQSPVVVAPGYYAAGYVPGPYDAYITNVALADVVFYRGDTFLWVEDANGRRYRRFYAHGDRRAEVFHRRDELHHAMARNGGHLPGRGGMEHRGVGGQHVERVALSGGRTQTGATAHTGGHTQVGSTAHTSGHTQAGSTAHAGGHAEHK
jgi:hypothetical protein